MTDCSHFSTASKQVLPVFWTGSDVDSLKAALLAQCFATDLSVQACAAVSDSERAAWGVFYTKVTTFAKESTSIFSAASQAGMVQQYESELCQWQVKLQGNGCTLAGPALDSTLGEPPGSGILKMLALAVIVVAGAYTVHQIAATVHDVVPERTK